MMRLRSALTVLALVSLMPGARGLAQEQQLDTVEQQLESSKQAEARIAAEIAAAIKEQDGVADKLVAISKAIQAQEASIAGTETELAKLATARAELLIDLGEKQDVLSELLAALQRLEQNPPPALVVKPDDILSALRGAMLLGTIVPELQEDANKLVAELDRLKQLEARITERKQAVADEIARLETARLDLNSLVARKKDRSIQPTGRQRGRQQARGGVRMG